MLLATLKSHRLWTLCFLAWLVVAFNRSAMASTEKYWELSPYRVKLHLVVDDSRVPQPRLGSQLTEQLAKQIRATIYPLWASEITLAEGSQKQQALDILQPTEDLNGDAYDLETLAAGCDKRIYLGIVLTRLGAKLSCRELDATTRRWGEVHSRLVRQNATLGANCLDLICETFAPIASVRSLPDDEGEVILSFRGSDLPQQTDLDFMTRAGETYQPVMLRTKSSGEVQPETIRDISWTYVSLREQTEDGWLANVHTGTRRPFGVRRRGRIKHLALAIRKPTGNTRLRFYARHDASQGLTGYEVFRREPGTKESVPLGLTDSEGAVEVLPGENPVTLLFLRSEGQLLAKVPVVPGAKAFVEVPIADDTARLRAQAALTSLSEQLIDTVAMRNILIARVRDRLNSGKLEEAQELFTDTR